MFAEVHAVTPFLAGEKLATTNVCSQSTQREKLVKIGVKVVRHANYVIFQLAEVAVPRRLFGQILTRIERLRALVAPAPS